MTSERHFYKHAETGIVSEITDRAAAVFGDRLIRVESAEPETAPEPESTKPKPARTSRKVETEQTDESPKEES